MKFEKGRKVNRIEISKTKVSVARGVEHLDMRMPRSMEGIFTSL